MISYGQARFLNFGVLREIMETENIWREVRDADLEAAVHYMSIWIKKSEEDPLAPPAYEAMRGARQHIDAYLKNQDVPRSARPLAMSFREACIDYDSRKARDSVESAKGILIDLIIAEIEEVRQSHVTPYAALGLELPSELAKKVKFRLDFYRSLGEMLPEAEPGTKIPQEIVQEIAR